MLRYKAYHVYRLMRVISEDFEIRCKFSDRIDIKVFTEIYD